MSWPAAELRARVLAEYPEAVVVERSHHSLKHRLADAPNGRQRFVLDCSIGPLHYGPNQNQEIDTALLPSTAPWNWEMTKAEFEVRALSRLDAGQVIEYRKDSEYVRFQPMALQYSNALDQIQPISMPANLDAAVEDDTLTWADGYGPDIDFSWQAQTARLAKRLTIDSPAALPPVAQYILDGGEPALELNFIFAHSKGVTPWINGEPWDKKQRDTQGHVEFKDKEGNTLWWCGLPRSWDAETGRQLGTFRFKRVGNSLYVSHRVPLTFVQNAVYPLTVDLDLQVGESGDDAHEETDGTTHIVDPQGSFGDYWLLETPHCGFRFSGVSGLSGATITTSTLSFYSKAADTGAFVADWYGEDAAAPGVFTTDANNVTGRGRTTATCEGDGEDFGNWSNNTWHDFTGPGGGIKGIIQELATSYDPSAIVLVNIYDSGSGERIYDTWDNVSANAAKLVIVFEGAAAGNIKEISGVGWANVKQVSGVAEASIKEVSGVTAN